MPPKRGPKGGAKDAAAAAIMSKMVEETLKTTEVKENINPVPQKEVILQNLVVYTDELSAEDRYRRKKLVIATICFLSNIIGLVITLYSQHLTVLFAAQPLSWTLFGVACIFFMPCFAWFFWTMCPRYKHCNWYCCDHPNWLFLKEHELRKTLKAQRDERARVARLTRLYMLGDIDPPAEALEPPDLPFEYDPAQPWAYIKWKPKPPIRVRYDEEGVAWIVTPEEQAAEEAAKLAARGQAAVEGKDDGLDWDEEEGGGGGGRRSSARKSSVAVKV